MAEQGWIGVDLDGTLAQYNGWTGNPYAIGKPVELMVSRVKGWLSEGKQVWIFTARICPHPWIPNDNEEVEKIKVAIQEWSQLHIGKVLPIVCSKNSSMIELWDDRVVQVIP